jgi:hypothetical protein
LLTTDQFRANILFKNMTGRELDNYPANLSMRDLYHLALDYSDGLMIIPGFDDPELREYAQKRGLPIYGPVDVSDRANGTDIVGFFDDVWSFGKVEEPVKDY